MSRSLICAALACALAPVASSAVAAEGDEAAIRQAFNAKFPRMSVESVARTPFAGLYELVVDGQVVYTDIKVSYLFNGNLLDLRGDKPRSLTQESTGRLNAAVLSKSTENAIRRVKGNGKRVIYTFEDPNCGYCKEFQKELAKLNDVTVYTYLWPILSQDSTDKSRAIWCAKDRARAWEDYMLRGQLPAGKRECDVAALERNAKLAQRFNLRGTPAVFIGSGEQVGGFVPAEKLEAAFAGR